MCWETMVFHRVSVERCRTTMAGWISRSATDTEAFVAEFRGDGADFRTNNLIQYLQFPLPLLINAQLASPGTEAKLRSSEHSAPSASLLGSHQCLKCSRIKIYLRECGQTEGCQQTHFAGKCCVTLLRNISEGSAELSFQTHHWDVSNCPPSHLLFRQKSVFPPHLSVRRRQPVFVLPGDLHYLISVDGGSVTHLLDEPSVRVPQSAGWSASINDFNPLLGPMSSC